MGGPTITTRHCRRCGERRPLNEFDMVTTCRDCGLSCLVCGSRLCDRHQVPPICICTTPDPDGRICRNWRCERLYLPHNLLFWECRAAWRRSMGLDELAAVG